jgi:broad specificity phosphatase PhoE
MTTWHWVRHAPTHQKSFVGWRDVPADLSDQDALRRLNASLPKEALVISSDLQRSIRTADALALGPRRRLPHQSGLREIHFGWWDGMHFDDIAARDPVLSRTFWEKPGRIRAPGGESWDMAADRVEAVVGALNSRFPDADIIAVAHFGAILTQVQRALGVNASDVLVHKIDNLSVTRIIREAGTREVAQINHTP